jgi:HEPN domain-containing protein
MNRIDLQELADVRLKEARALLNSGQFDGAYYLAGYSVECALKACIAKRTLEHDFPEKKLVNESHTHNLPELMRLAQLASILKAAMLADSRLEDDWIAVQDWNEASRYKRWDLSSALSLLDAIENQSGGLLPWIKLHW